MAKKKEISVEDKLRALYNLQLIDSRIDEIRNVRGELPLEVEDLEDEVAGLSLRVDNFNNDIESLNTQIKAKLNAIEESKELMKKYTKQQENVRNNREYNSLAKETEFQELEIESIDENMDLVNLELNKVDVYEKALGILPEIQSSNLNIEANKKQLDIAKGGFLPTLSLSGSLGSGYTSINDNTFYDQFDVNFNQKLGLTLTIPIFNRNQTKSAVQTASINIEKAEIQKLSTEKEVYKKVETAYQNALSAQEQVIAAEASKVASEQSFKLAQKKQSRYK